MKPRFVRVCDHGAWRWCCYSTGVVNGGLRYVYGIHETEQVAYAQWLIHAVGAGLRTS